MLVVELWVVHEIEFCIEIRSEAQQISLTLQFFFENGLLTNLNPSLKIHQGQII